jgi:hypothetical protein
MRKAIARYSVRVVYTEPEFQRRTPDAPTEYHFDYPDIPAGSPAAAIDSAVRNFWHTASLSRVGWRRCIQSVSILDRVRPRGRRAPRQPRSHS